jgi:hypothetical protein
VRVGVLIEEPAHPLLKDLDLLDDRLDHVEQCKRDRRARLTFGSAGALGRRREMRVEVSRDCRALR